MNNYNDWIGKKVSKISGKPFKSHEKVNTVKGTMMHPALFDKGKTVLAFIFCEDDSYVRCDSCKLYEEDGGV